DVVRDRNAQSTIGVLHYGCWCFEGRNSVIERVSGLGQVVQVIAIGFPAVLGAYREPDRSARQPEQLPEITGEEARCNELSDLAARFTRNSEILANGLCDGAVTKRVQGHARCYVRGKNVIARNIRDRRRGIDLRAANNLAVGIPDGIDREQVTLDVDVAINNVAFFVLAIVGRDFIVPVVIELATNTDNAAVGFTTNLLVANAEFDSVTTQRDAGSVGGSLTASYDLLFDDRASFRRKIGVIQPRTLPVSWSGITKRAAL